MAEKNPNKSKSAAGGDALVAPEPPRPFVTTDPHAAFQFFAPIAAKVPREGLRPSTIDVRVARTNVAIGVRNLLGRRADVDARLRDFPWHDVEELPALVEALDVAIGRIVAPPAVLKQRLATMRPMRELTLSQLEIHAALGLVPEERVAAIRAGTGDYDSARDAVAIVGLYREFAPALAGRHPFTDQQLETLLDDGSWLLRHLTPAGSKDLPAGEDPDTTLRDQLASLIEDRHALLREGGAIAFGMRKVDEMVPPLRSRVRGPRTRDDEPPPGGEGGEGDGGGGGEGGPT